MENKRIHITVYGRVHGVSFRAGAADSAGKFGLKGWARNNPDGTVEIVAEGAETGINLLLDWCNKGPLISHVKKVESYFEPFTGEFKDFTIRY